MNVFTALRSTFARLFFISTLSLGSLSLWAAPIQPGLFIDPNLQLCFDEAVVANGWTLTEEVTSLHCSGRQIVHLEGLQHLTSLLELDLSHNQIFSAYPLDMLPSLKLLDLSNNRLLDVYPLFNLYPMQMDGLTHLNLSENRRLDGQLVKQIITNHPGLTHIGLAGITLGDLYWLPAVGPQGEFNIQELDISETGVYFDLAPVAWSFPDLRVLKAAGNEVMGDSSLGSLQLLEVLDLSNNLLGSHGSAPGSATELTTLNRLTQLNLSGNKRLDGLVVKQIVNNNPGLTHLGVAGINLGDLNWLPPMGPMGEFNLLELDISETGQFVDLVPVTQYPNLRSLKAAGNQLEHVLSIDLLQQLEVLDLSNNQLFDVYPLLMLHSLTQLNLSRNTRLQATQAQTIVQANPGLTHLGLAGIKMDDLYWIPHRGPLGEFNLQELDISDTGSFIDLDPVLQFTDLRVLKSAGNHLQHIASGYAPFDEPFSQLEVLDLSNNPQFNINSLPLMHQLTQLNMSGNIQLEAAAVKTMISFNPGLTHISIAGITMGDLSWLPDRGSQGEYDLQELDISDTGSFLDLYAVSQYTNLQVLKAAGNQLQYASWLGQLEKLAVLDLSNNQLFDIYPLQMLNRLTQLNLSNNTQLDPQNVKQFVINNPGLTHLGLAGIALGDLNWLPATGPLGEFNLQELDISQTGIYPDLLPVVQFVNLRVLKAAGNQLQQVWSLELLEQLEVLDLSNNKLQGINPLQMLSGLTELNLSANLQLDEQVVKQVVNMNPGLTHLGVAGINMGDMYWLPPMGPQGEFNLQELDISETAQLTDLSPVTMYTNLRSLKAAGNHLQTTGPLEMLAQLEVLDLSHNQLFDINSLQMMYGLKQLNMSGNNKLDPASVSYIVHNNPRLTHLGVADIRMGDLNWLPAMWSPDSFNFQELDISNTGDFLDLYGLAQYQNLRVLKAAGNQIQSLGSLFQLMQLEILDLSDNQLVDVNDLSYMNNLQQLNLSNNKSIDSYSMPIDLQTVNQIIQSNPRLSHLGLAGIVIGDLNLLASLNNPYSSSLLIELDVSQTGISDLTPLFNAPGLRVLKASGNSIEQVAALDQSLQLQVLDLSDNALIDVTPLQQLQSLMQLKLSGNNLLPAFQVQNIVLNNFGLTHLGVAGIAMGDLNWLPPMGPMGEYNLLELDISSTGHMPDPYTLASYKNLKVLRAANNSIEIIWWIDQLAFLEELDLSQNRLFDIESLKMLHNLRQLNLSGNVLPDPMVPGIDLWSVNQVIEGNPALTHLGLGGVYINQLSQLAIFTAYTDIANNIVELDLSNTGVVDITSVQMLSNLHVLNVSGNQIVDAQSLYSLEQLTDVNLSNNNLQFVPQFINPLGLLSLDLRGNNTLQCYELDTLETQLLPGVLLRPLSCVMFTPPEVTILLNPAYSVYFSTTPVDLVASAFDAEDGNLEALVQWTSSLDGPLGTGALIVNLSAGEHVIYATVVDSHGNTTTASVIINVLPNTAPELLIDPLLDGTLINQDELVILSASAMDAEEGDLSYQIIWESSLSGFLGAGPFVQLPLSVGSHIVTATVMDNTGTLTTKNITIRVNALPVLAIQLPLAATVYQQDTPVSFAATASDSEDGLLDTAIIWTSSLDGTIGTGPQFTRLLSVGSHIITASITDSAGAVTTQTTGVSVNSTPQISALLPVSGSLYMLQETVTLSATANDLEEGDISASIQWFSDVDGFLGAGAVLNKALTLGAHTISASITDLTGGVFVQTTTLVIDEIKLGVTVSGNGRRKTATLTWSGSRTPVDIYKNGIVIAAAAANGSATYRFRDQAVFKVCETTTTDCSVNVTAL